MDERDLQCLAVWTRNCHERPEAEATAPTRSVSQCATLMFLCQWLRTRHGGRHWHWQRRGPRTEVARIETERAAAQRSLAILTLPTALRAATRRYGARRCSAASRTVATFLPCCTCLRTQTLANKLANSNVYRRAYQYVLTTHWYCHLICNFKMFNMYTYNCNIYLY